MELFPYQRKGVTFLERRKGRALIADEMGLGKTVQVLGWLQHRRSYRPTIIICPTSVRLHWQSLIRLMLHEECYLPYSQTAAGIGYENQSFIIIHYSIVPFWVDWLRALKPKVIVVDEAQAIKTNNTKRTNAVKALARKVPHVIGLTGTPIVNRPSEAFNILQIIDRKTFPNQRKYAERYCDRKLTYWGWDESGAINIPELHELLSSVMLRRRKVDVLKSLPPKIRSFVPLELTNRKEYTAAEKDFIGYVRETEGKEAAKKANKAAALTKVTFLRLLAARGKLEQAIDWIANTIEEQKLVVFAVHREILDPVFNAFRKVAVRVDGSVNEAERGRAIDRFQKDPKCRLFVGQTQAAGTGITLTAASNVAFLELPWTPGDLLQCEDRCHRIGQVNSVTIHYLLAANTIDEKMADLIDRKRRILDSVHDGETFPSILAELLNHYNKRG